MRPFQFFQIVTLYRHIETRLVLFCIPPLESLRPCHAPYIRRQVYYTFANAKSGQLYGGNAQNYQGYQELAAQKRMAQEEYRAVEMNEGKAMDWDMWGFYGPTW